MSFFTSLKNIILKVGPDICGFGGEPTPELCRRWQQLGAFYPFSRNHNAIENKDQDPAVWATTGHPEVTEAARNSMSWRYSMLRYLYTLFFRAHTMGETVARPVFHEFSHDNNTHGIDKQFMWGRSVLISPFLFEVKIISSFINNKVLDRKVKKNYYISFSTESKRS